MRMGIVREIERVQVQGRRWESGPLLALPFFRAGPSARGDGCGAFGPFGPRA